MKLKTIRAVLMLGIVCTMLGGHVIEAKEADKTIRCKLNPVVETFVEQTKPKIELNKGYPLDVTIQGGQLEIMNTDVENSAMNDEWKFTEEEEHLLAKLIMAEAEGESYKGKLLVAQVVLNRLKSENFPDTLHDVVYQKKQFSCVADGRLEKAVPNDDCIRAVKEFQRQDFSQGATYFCTGAEDGWHGRSLNFVLQEQNHRFYKEF